MKLRIITEVVSPTSIKTIDFDELGLTEEKWDSLDEEQQKIIIQDYINEMPDQPVWGSGDYRKI